MLEQLIGLWDRALSVFDSVPENTIAIVVYVLGTLIILWCWYAIAKRLPSPFGGLSWIVIFAILATPTVSEGTNAKLAPAIFGLIFGMLTKEQALVWLNLSLILFVAGLGLIIGYLWSRYKLNRPNLSI